MVLVCPPCPKVSLEKLNKRSSFSKYLDVLHALGTQGSVASINRTTVTMNFSRSLPLTLIFHSYCSPTENLVSEDVSAWSFAQFKIRS